MPNQNQLLQQYIEEFRSRAEEKLMSPLRGKIVHKTGDTIESFVEGKQGELQVWKTSEGEEVYVSQLTYAMPQPFGGMSVRFVVQGADLESAFEGFTERVQEAVSFAQNLDAKLQEKYSGLFGQPNQPGQQADQQVQQQASQAIDDLVESEEESEDEDDEGDLKITDINDLRE